MTDRHPVNTSDAPAAIGPYNQAVVGGGLVHCSGQIALDPATGELVGDDVVTQADQALKNLGAVLEAAGSSYARVLKCNVYLKDMGDFAAVNEVYTRYFNREDAPARACVEAAGLPKGALFEVDCVALVP